MSQLWPDLLRITLCPDQIVLERGKLVISLRGVEQRYAAPEIIPVEARHEPTLWAAPLAMLGLALDGLPDRRHDVSVVLSNHFVHYPLVDPDSAGDEVIPDGMADPQLERSLREVLERHACRINAIEPRIVAIATSHPDELQGEPGWLVAIEEGLACLGLIEDGEFTRLRNLYMWPASSVELLRVLDRQARLAGLDRAPRTLLLWTRDEADEVSLPSDGSWHILRLGRKSASPMPPPLAAQQHPAGIRP